MTTGVLTQTRLKLPGIKTYSSTASNYYRQDRADFFQNIADLSQPFFADDYRLSAYDATTMGLHGFYRLGDWLFEAQVERYTTSATGSISSIDTAPALVDFWRGTVGISWRFD